jgi:hypothetical protein
MLAHAQASLLSATSRTSAFEPDLQAAATVRGIGECNWDKNCSLQATLRGVFHSRITSISLLFCLSFSLSRCNVNRMFYKATS